ncbi:MAG: LPS export ABC transporter periplasmic protein LptC [Candidatus Solibacter usitatus]|nr:LPS export ABC transporter periplasmic protein LptC [Candidatus Solibacter usitatus]
MRRARPFFLFAIIGIAGYLGVTYLQRMELIRKRAPAALAALPLGINATASDWHWEKSTGEGPAVAVRAKSFRQLEEANRIELEKIELKIYRKNGKTYDQITSDKAIFDIGEGSLYSEGEADILMGVEEGAEPSPSRVIRIKSSGIQFDSKTGKATTEREAIFALEKGEGRAVGAVYDPGTRELLLKSKARLTWKGQDGESPHPITVESNEVIYKESESKVWLSPWAKMTRENSVLEGKATLIHLDKSGIRKVETSDAKGTDKYPKRQLEYSAAQLTMSMSEKSTVERMEARGNSRLVTTSDQGVTTTNADAVDLEFTAQAGESILKRVTARGKTIVESKPAVRADKQQAETRVMRSEVVELSMRSGGHEIDTLETKTPGVLEFLPNRPGQHKRRVEGAQFLVHYGAGNQIDSFRTTQASTRTENEPKQGKPSPPSLTWSREMTALFAPKTGEMTRLEQWGDFRYEEGDRKARSERALLDNVSGRITLLQGARLADATGTTAADQIVLDQKGEDFLAEGNVTSSRAPDKKGSGSAMLARDEPVQAKAARMTTYDKQSLVIYEGGTNLWQGASRLQAERIEIDRKNSQLRANGKVVSQLLDKQKDDPKNPKSKNGAPVYTLITAPSLVYTDKDRLAHYTGGAFLRREELDVKAREIRAFLSEEKKSEPQKPAAEDSGASLERAAADGSVVIVQVTPQRTRKGMSDHADYLVNEGKVVLEEGQPVLEDTLRGVTKGRQLIYYANDDRLLVNGVPAQPAASKLLRRK